MTPTRAPSAAAALLDLLLPRTCGGCGAGPPGSGGWCPACAQDTAGPVPVRVPGAGRDAAAGRYRGPLR
ncbi:double zinc ribbon domain-containing protein, partial [Pseudonocardia alni]|uniref:double zinc ribbon domain-containing protein n=1 Tax=Pseudonocardia alni TaxID=33907 RepID=UPI0031F9533F